MANLSSRKPVPRGGGWRPRLLIVTALGLLAFTGTIGQPNQASAQAGRRPAIELDGGHGWLGTDRPLSLKALRGKIVLLEFWTSC
jgi:hypothetical protein